MMSESSRTITFPDPLHDRPVQGCNPGRDRPVKGRPVEARVLKPRRHSAREEADRRELGQTPQVGLHSASLSASLSATMSASAFRSTTGEPAMIPFTFS